MRAEGKRCRARACPLPQKQKLFEAIVGMRAEEVKKTVIISPIIYPTQLAKIINQKIDYQRSILGYLTANIGAITFVKTSMTQGAVSDLVKLLVETECAEVVFIGAIGGLQSSLKIGDTVEVNTAKNIHSFHSMLDQTIHKLKLLQAKGMIGIDFESQVFFKEAKKAMLLAQAYYVVTDLPLTKPFYLAKSKDEEEKIQLAIRKIIQNLLK
ncbi:MAG: hypothetical protein WC890_05045 [Candidatus Margulisiibacteriota bacterium]